MSIPVTHPAAKNRYLLNTKTQALERVALSLTKTPEAVRALVRGAVLEPFRRRGNGDDESVASFFKRRFGPAAAGVASAFVHGIYAADPDKLSVRAAFGILTAAEKRYGSVVLGMLLGARTTAEKEAEKAAWASVGQLGQDRAGWSMYALRRGMQSLTDRLEERIRHAGGDVLLGTPVQRIENGDGVKVSNGLFSLIPGPPPRVYTVSRPRRRCSASEKTACAATFATEASPSQPRDNSRRSQRRLPPPSIRSPPRRLRISHSTYTRQFQPRRRPGCRIRLDSAARNGRRARGQNHKDDSHDGRPALGIIHFAGSTSGSGTPTTGYITFTPSVPALEDY